MPTTHSCPLSSCWNRLGKTCMSAVLAGVCITLGCVINLSVGGALGAFMFSFGLLSVILWKFSLYTGAMGFACTQQEFALLLVILFGNLLGCALAGVSISYAHPELVGSAEAVMSKHLALSGLKAFILSSWCGFVMTIIVRCGRMQPTRQLSIVIIGIAVFILSGFIHCIADAGYLFMCSPRFLGAHTHALLPFYGIIVLGNFVGGNLVRILLLQLHYAE